MRVMRRALSLQQLNQGLPATQVSVNVGLAPKTVRAIAYRFEDEGLQAALQERPRPGGKPKITVRHKQQIIAMVRQLEQEGVLSLKGSVGEYVV